MKKILLLAAAAAALLMTAACQKPGRDDVTIDEGFVWAAANAGARDSKSLGFERLLKSRPLTPPNGYHVPSEAEWRRLHESCTWSIYSNTRVIFATGTSKTTGETIDIPLEKEQYDLIPSGSYLYDQSTTPSNGTDYSHVEWRYSEHDGITVGVSHGANGEYRCMIRYVKD